MEKKMQTIGTMWTIYKGDIGRREKKMETLKIVVSILGLYRDNGKENGNYYDGV